VEQRLREGVDEDMVAVFPQENNRNVGALAADRQPAIVTEGVRGATGFASPQHHSQLASSNVTTRRAPESPLRRCFSFVHWRPVSAMRAQCSLSASSIEGMLHHVSTVPTQPKS
jgi:hypothetical protein